MSEVHSSAGLDSRQLIEQGEGAARQYSRHFDNSGYVNMGAVITELGGTVQYVCQPKNLLSVYDEDEFNISLNESISNFYGSYLMARALGHYKLHYQLPRSKSADGMTPRQAVFRQEESDPVGKEAHMFSLGFLLPEVVFEKAIKSNHGIPAVVNRLELPKWLVEERMDLRQELRNR